MRRFAAWQLVPNESLPLLETVAELRPKSSAEVAARAVSAGYVAAACFGAPTTQLRKDLERFGLWEHLTPDEQGYLNEPNPTDQSVALHSWLIESIQFLAWSLGLDALDNFTPCSEALATHFPRGGIDPVEFVSQATLRPMEEVLQEADTLYMLHWRAVENNLGHTPDARVVLPRLSFRRHAADWTIGVAEGWEDVSLDT